MLVLASQVGVAGHSLRIDHDRRKKEATINCMLQVRPLWHQGRRVLDSKWGKGVLTESALTEIDDDFSSHEVVRTLLGHLELLSIGVHSGVYDLDLLNRMSGFHLCSMYDRLKPYIKRVQGKLPTAYIEFERLVTKIRLVRGSGGDSSESNT